MSAMDIRGFLIDGGTAATDISIPFVGWFAGIAIKVLRDLGARQKTVRFLSDYLTAQTMGTIPDAVLVARMRDSLSNTAKNAKYGY